MSNLTHVARCGLRSTVKLIWTVDIVLSWWIFCSVGQKSLFVLHSIFYSFIIGGAMSLFLHTVLLPRWGCFLRFLSKVGSRWCLRVPKFFSQIYNGAWFVDSFFFITVISLYLQQKLLLISARFHQCGSDKMLNPDATFLWWWFFFISISKNPQESVSNYWSVVVWIFFDLWSAEIRRF